MNCLPTGRILSGKSKAKYPLSATQKYEQRIKDAKQKPSFQDIGARLRTAEPCDCGPCLDEWVSKRKEIDKWRKSVLYACQAETVNSTSSSNVTEYQTQPDSPTLTTSNTLCSANEAHKQKLLKDRQATAMATTEDFCKVQKSPSIPLFNSNGGNNAVMYSDFYHRHNKDPAISIVDDDEVFVPIELPHYTGYSSNTVSSNPHGVTKFVSVANNNLHGQCYVNEYNVNRKYTPQPIKKPLFLPLYNYYQIPENQIERFHDRRHVYQNPTPEFSAIKHGQNNQVNSFIEPLTPTHKKTIHKTETNAKLVLRPTNSSSHNDQFPNRSPFQRTMSLNIKRTPTIANQHFFHQSAQINTDRRAENQIQKRDLQSSSSKAKLSRNNYDNVNESFFTTPHQNYRTPKFIVLKPTFSQENICGVNDQINNSNQNHPIPKISSYSNLQTAVKNIPKVSINEPLTMKFVFGSEPSLLRNY